MEDYFKRIMEVAETKGMSLYKLANESGVDRSILTRWMNNETTPKVTTLKKICDTLGVTMSYIINGFEDEYEASMERSIPVLGVVPCGNPMEAIEDIIEYIEVVPSMIKDHFGLISKGESMFPFICEGDILIVKKTPRVASGKIAIVKVNGDEATCKKILINKNGITLIPLNNLYQPVFYAKNEVEKLPVSIIGEVVEIRRRF